MNMFELEDAFTALDDHMRLVESKQYGPVEERPSKFEVSDTDRIDWLGEYGKYEYTEGAHVIVDRFGQRTVSEVSFRDALDLAIARFLT